MPDRIVSVDENFDLPEKVTMRQAERFGDSSTPEGAAIASTILTRGATKFALKGESDISSEALTALPTISLPPVLTLTKTSTPTPEITSPIVYPYNDSAFLFTGNGPGVVGIYGKNATGAATSAYFEWWSDAPLFDIRLNGSNLRGSLLVDGQLASESDIITDTSGADYVLKVDFGGIAKPRRYRFIGINLLFGGVRVPGEYTCWRPNELRPFAWGIGDSYMFGTGAAPIIRSAFNTMCHNLGIDGLADGIGGSGWVASADGSLPSPQSRIMSKLTTLTRKPDYVFFDLGYNNAQSNLEAVTAGFNESISLVRQHLPNAQIIVFGPATPQGMTTQLNGVRSVLKTRSAALGVHYLETEGIITAGNKVRFTGVDAVHPNNAGHQFIGQRKSILAKSVLDTPAPNPVVPVNYGLTDYDHIYPLSSLSLADNTALTVWPDKGTAPDNLISLGVGNGSFGTSVYRAEEGGFVRLNSTSGNGKLLATTGIVSAPRTTVIVGRATKGRQMARVGGALLSRVGTTGEYLLTASGTGSGGQLLTSSVNTDDWVCIILRTDATSASMFINGTKHSSGTWVAGAPTTLRLQTNDPDPADFKFAASVNRIVSDTEAASIYAAMKSLYLS